MTRTPRATWPLLTALLLVACQGPAVKPLDPLPKPSGLRKDAGLIGLDAASLIGLDGASLVGLDAASLVGLDAASLIGDGGGTLVHGEPTQPVDSSIAKEGNQLVGQDGSSFTGTVRAPAGLIGQDGARVVSNDGAGLTGKGRYGLAALAEAPVAKARVYLRTAEGKYVSKDGKPLVATCDAQGRFAFPKIKTSHNLVAVVPVRSVGGKLQALLAVAKPDGSATDLALASTLATAYILEKFVAPQADAAATLDRLTPALDQLARASTAGAIGDAVPAGLDGLSTERLVAAVDALQAGSADLTQTMIVVRTALVLAGNDSTRAGREVLNLPIGAVKDAQGALYTLEELPALIRKFPSNGPPQLLFGPGSKHEVLLKASSLALGPDGWLYFSLSLEQQVYKLSPDGEQAIRVAGGGRITDLTGRPAATDVKVRNPACLAFDRDGALLIGEAVDPGQEAGRVLRVDADGTVTDLAAPFAGLPSTEVVRKVTGVAVDADGAIWAVESRTRTLARRAPDKPWEIVARDLDIAGDNRLTPAPGGGVLLSRPAAHAIDHITAAGRVTPYAVEGTAEVGATGPLAAARFSRPIGLFHTADGTVIVADRGSGLVREVGLDGVVRTVAGTQARGQGVATGFDLNIPAGLALDASGRLLIAEFGANGIQRLEGDRLVQLAGGPAGFTGDGGDLAAATFAGVSGVATVGGDMYLLDQGNKRVRKVDAQGKVSTVVGGVSALPLIQEGPVLGTTIRMTDPWGIAAGPDGSLYFSERQHIYRLTPDGMVVAIAGAFEGQPISEAEGAPGLMVKLSTPFGLTSDAKGDLYIGDSSKFTVRKIDMSKPDHPITTFAGSGLFATLAAVKAGTAQTEADVPALEASLLLATGLAVGPDGTVYIAEAGTVGVGNLARSGSSDVTGLDLPELDLPKLGGRIRAVGPDGRARTLIGTGAPPNRPERIGTPYGLVRLPDGRLAFSDSLTNQVKAITP